MNDSSNIITYTLWQFNLSVLQQSDLAQLKSIRIYPCSTFINVSVLFH